MSDKNADNTSLGLSDDALIECQINRKTRANSEVVSRCHLGLPVVVSVPPVLDTGEPFPTRFWLSCPLAHKRIARLEAAGGVRSYDERMEQDADFRTQVEAAHVAYAKTRDAALPTEVRIAPRGGVGGVRAGVKCLHAHYAHTRGGGENPIGAEVLAAIEPLDCGAECVVQGPSGAVRNPHWFEPARS